MTTAIPNLFIVGAPKCGTTSLYEYLRRQPQIFFPHNQDTLGRAKEPNHFCPELEITARYSIKDRDEYKAAQAKAQYAVPEDKLVEEVKKLLAKHNVSWG